MHQHLLICLFLVKAASIFSQTDNYTQPIPGTEFSIDLVFIPAGSFSMGSASFGLPPITHIDMPGFYISTTEITYDQYLPFREKSFDSPEAASSDYQVDAVTRPTPPYLDFTYGMGSRGGFPAVSMTQQAALRYCKWLYEKTGYFYRLPTEAEWEYACKAGSDFSPSGKNLDLFAWYFDNSDDHYHPVAQKQPNPWGLYDMLGNVAEYTSDMYTTDRKHWDPQRPQEIQKKPRGKYNRTVKGGAYDDDASACHCSYRTPSLAKWQARDPQIPKSIWWNPDSPFVGFRIVRPVGTFTREQVETYFHKTIVE